MSKFYGERYFGGEFSFSMSGPFFGGPFFDGGFFGASESESASAPVVPGGVKRKRRILPDGRQIFATEQEAVDTLLLYYHEHKLKPKESAVLGLEPKRKKVIVLPSERRDIIDALETLKDSNWKARRQEEEWLLLFH